MPAKRVSILTYEGDRSGQDLLQRKLLAVLKEADVQVATVVPAVAGYTKEMGITTRHLVDAGGRLPVMVEFVASSDQLQQLLPTIRTMAGQRTITITDVDIESPVHAA